MKKAWYKKWWVWVLAVVSIFVMSSILNPSDDKASQRSNSKTHQTSKTNTDQDKVLAVGDTATMDGATLKVNSVKATESFNAGLSTPKTGNQFYTVNITIKNTGKKKIRYNPFDFKINANGNQTDFSEIDTSDSDRLESGELTAGGTVTGNLTGQSKKDGSVQMIYTPSFFSERHLTFKLQ